MNKQAGDVKLWFMPYCVRRQPDGRYAILNRRMVPVGLVLPDPASRDERLSDAHLVRLPGLTPMAARLISWDGSEDTEAVYLYKSADRVILPEETFEAYASRLYVLMQLVVEQ